MAYKVLTYFEDLQDNSHPYNPGDEFPRSGLRVSMDRVLELSGKDNRRGTQLIELAVEKKAEPETVEKKAEPKKTGAAANSKKRSKKTS